MLILLTQQVLVRVARQQARILNLSPQQRRTLERCIKRLRQAQQAHAVMPHSARLRLRRATTQSTASTASATVQGIADLSRTTVQGIADFSCEITLTCSWRCLLANKSSLLFIPAGQQIAYNVSIKL
jgi:hypothetical protein